MIIRKLFFLLSFFTLSFSSFSQISEKIKSLEKELLTASDTARVKILLDLSFEYRRLDLDRSMELATEADALAHQMNFERGIALSQRVLASAYFGKSQLAKAETLAKESVNLLRDIGTYSERAVATNLLGLCLMNQGRYFEAERWFTDAAGLYKMANDELGETKALSNMGVVLFYQGNYSASTKNYLNALRVAESRKDTIMIAEIRMNLGHNFSIQKDFVKSTGYLRDAANIFKQMGDVRGAAKAISGLGTSYFNWGKHDSSYVYHEEALQLFLITGDQSGAAQSLNNQGEILLLRKKFPEALALFEQVLSIRKETLERYPLAIAYANMGKAHVGMGHFNKGKELLGQALKIAYEIDSDWLKAEFYLAYAEAYESQGLYKDALLSYKNYNSLRDSLFSSEKTKAISELQTRYETEKKEQDLVIKDNQIILLERDRKLYSLAVVSILVIVLLFGGLVFSFFTRNRIRQRKNLELAEKNRLLEESKRKAAETELRIAKVEQEQMKSELEFKRKELTQLALHINQQNEFLETIREDLKSAGSDDVKSISRDLEVKLNISKQREAFELNIDLINADFYQRLQQRFASLTEHDRKLCAMVRLGLSSKEIASISNISPKSVDMNRYRLRKKLELDIETDLSTFLAEV
jgi:tetratricopeptide (TPR) repeat protein